MSAGPATKMYDALFDVDGSTDEPEVRDLAAEAIAEIDDATLEAMDAAAEVMSSAPPAAPLLQEGGIHPDWVVFHARDAKSQTGWRNVVCLAPKEADELLRRLLEREVQRRKEAGHGA